MTRRHTRGVLPDVKALALAVVVLSLVCLAASVDVARACTCGPVDPGIGLQKADGAFVGRVVARRDTGGNRIFTFDVERTLKGRIGETVEVRGGGGCALEAEVGERIGLFVARKGMAWVGWLCSQVDPDDLLAAAAPLPPPTGRGPPATYVGGRVGDARMISLDALGRTLAYGRGKGVTRHLSVCPRTGRVAELAYDGSTNTSRLTIRDGRSLRVVGQRAVHLPGSRHPHGLLCENASGSEVVVFAYPGDRRGHALYRLTNGTPREIWYGSAYLSSLVPGAAYLNAGLPDGKRLTKVDLRTGRVQRIATLPLRPRLVPDATGRRLAGIAYRIQRRSRLVLVDLRGKAPVVRWVALDAREVDGDVHFLPNGRLLFLPTAGDTARVLDGSLRTLHRFPWAAHDSALVGTSAWGVGRTGELVSAPVPGGPGRTVRQLPGGARPEVIVSATR